MTDEAWLASAAGVGFALALIIQELRLYLLRKRNRIALAESEEQGSQLTQEKALSEERVRSLDNSLSVAKTEIESLRSENTDLHRLAAGNEERCRHFQDRLSEQKKEMLELQTKLTAEFETLATRVLDLNSQKFVSRNQESLDKLLSPLSQKIGDFRNRVEVVHDQSVKDRAELVAQLKTLGELNQQMSVEARNLTTALKGQNKTQGNWGELILETVLEKSGLEKDREYKTQSSFRTSDGKRQQPDVLICLPEGKHLVIDAKVSLVSYERCVNAEDETTREEALKRHIHSVRQHVAELSKKRYDSIYEIESPDFTLMFVPVEPAFVVAIQKDDTLFDYAFRQNVIIVTPSTLLATLRTVSNIWRQEKQTRNALDIAEKSGALYDKFVGFFEDMQKIGEQIGRSQVAYDSAMNKLSLGRGNLVNHVQRLKDMGAKAKKNLPSDVAELAAENLGRDQ